MYVMAFNQKEQQYSLRVRFFFSSLLIYSLQQLQRLNTHKVKTKLIARLVLRQKGKIYWPIFQLAELVFFRASTM